MGTTLDSRPAIGDESLGMLEVFGVWGIWDNTLLGEDDDVKVCCCLCLALFRIPHRACINLLSLLINKFDT